MTARSEGGNPPGKSFFYIRAEKHSDNQGIILHGIDAGDGVRHSFFVVNFFPFIGVENNDKNLETILELERKGIVIRKEFYTADQQYYRDLFEKPAIVIYFRKTDDVNVFRVKFTATFQDDVRYITVFKTRKNIHAGFHVKDWGQVSKRNLVPLPAKRGGKKNPIYRILYEEEIKGF